MRASTSVLPPAHRSTPHSPPSTPHPRTRTEELPLLRYGYSRPNASYYNGEPIEPNVVCNYGGHARYFLEDAAALQADTGLTFSQEDGTLSGTPTCVGNPAPCYAERAFAVTAYNRAGSDSSLVPRTPTPVVESALGVVVDATQCTCGHCTGVDRSSFRLRVVHRPPQLGFYREASPTYTWGEAVAENNVVPNSGGRDGLIFTIVKVTPNGLSGSALPAGLAFSAEDGTISGTPVQGANAAKYLVRAENDGGASVTPLFLRVRQQAPNISLGFEPMAVATSADPLAFTALEPSAFRGESGTVLHMRMGDALPNGRVLLRGTVDASASFTVYPPLPSGLSIAHPGPSDPTAALVGSPTSSTNNVTTLYTVRALTSAGASYATLELKVLPPPPAIHGLVGGNVLHATVGLPIDERPPNSSGGDGTCTLVLRDNPRGWSNVPPGLSLHTSSGVLTGVPLYEREAHTYRLTCANGGGVSGAEYTLSVSQPAPLDESLAVSLDAGALAAVQVSLGREGLKAALVEHIEQSLTAWSEALYPDPFVCNGRLRLDCLRLDLSELYFTVQPLPGAPERPTALNLSSARSLMNELVSQISNPTSRLHAPNSSSGLPASGLFTSPLRVATTGNTTEGDELTLLTNTEHTLNDGYTISSAFDTPDALYQLGTPIAPNNITVASGTSGVFYTTSGGLPPGLSLVEGVLTGTPTEERARREYKIKVENYRSKVCVRPK